MTPEEARAALLRALGSVAPEADLEHLRPEADFREQLDIDSMDFLNFLIALHKDLGIEVPEEDYPRMARLGDSIEYIRSRLAAQAPRERPPPPSSAPRSPPLPSG